MISKAIKKKSEAAIEPMIRSMSEEDLRLSLVHLVANNDKWKDAGRVIEECRKYLDFINEIKNTPQ